MPFGMKREAPKTIYSSKNDSNTNVMKIKSMLYTVLAMLSFTTATFAQNIPIGQLPCSIGSLREQNELFDFFASCRFGEICLSLQLETNAWESVDDKTKLSSIQRLLNIQ